MRRWVASGGILVLVALIVIGVARWHGRNGRAVSPARPTSKPVPASVSSAPELVPAATVQEPAAVAPAGAGPAVAVPRASDTPVSSSLTTLPKEGPGLILYGRITLVGGQPGEGAEVRMQRRVPGKLPEGPFVRGGVAGPDGSYRVTTQDEFWRVRVELAGYASAETWLESPPMFPGASGTRHVRRDFVLAPGARVRGRVEGKDGAAIPGATVAAFSIAEANFLRRTAPTAETATDTSGTFELASLAPGEARLVAMANGFVPAVQSVKAPDENVVLRMERTREPGAIDGAVFLKSSGKGVPEARVEVIPSFRALGKEASAWVVVRTRSGTVLVPKSGPVVLPKQQAMTDANGFFHVGDLLAGVYTVEAQKEGLHAVLVKGDAFQKVDLREGETRSGIEIYLYEGHRISGQVTDKTTGTPLEGVAVSARTMAQEMSRDVTGADGTYTVQAWGDSANLDARKDGYALADPNDPRSPLYLTLTPEVLELTRDIHMVPALTVSGRVVRPDGSPAGGAEVSAAVVGLWKSCERFLPAHADGSFEVSIAPNRDFALLARAPGYATTASSPLQIRETPIRDVELRLADSARLSGVVVDEKDQPVARAVVRCWMSIALSPTASDLILVEPQYSDEEGHFEVTSIPVGGELEVWAECSGYARGLKEKWTPKAGEVRTDLRLVLGGSFHLAGRVTDAEGAPLEGVDVMAQASASVGTDRTDTQGQFRIPNLANRPHKVQATHSDYGTKIIPDVVPGVENFVIVMSEGEGNKFVGTVVEAGTGKPVDDFTVRLDTIPVLPGVAPSRDPKTPGRFVLRGLPAEVRLRVNLDSPRFHSYQSEFFWFASGERVLEKTFEVGSSATILGRVVEKGTGRAQSDILVLLKSASNPYTLPHIQPQTSVHTDGDGRFRFEKAMAGHHVVIVDPAPRPQVPVTLQVKHGEVRDLGDVEIGGGGAAVEGRLYRMPGESGVGGVAVEMNNEAIGFVTTATTDANGAFRLEGLPSGRYLIKCKQFNLVRFVDLEDGKTRQLDLVLGNTAVRGRVLRAGVPVSGQVVIYQESGAFQYAMPTGADGRFAFENLLAGTWTLNAHEPPKHIYRLLELREGETREVDLVFASGAVQGRVVDSDDNPVEGAEVVLQRLQTPSDGEDFVPKTEKATTGSPGTFQFSEVPDGTYRVLARKEGVGAQEVDARVADGATAVVVLRLASLTGGTLVSITRNLNTGAPISDANLALIRTEGAIPLSDKRNEKGVLEIRNLPPGDYRVRVGGARYSVASHEVTIQAGETTTIEDALYEAGSLAWSIRDAQDRMQSASCRVTPLDPSNPEPPREGQALANAGGYWEEGLRPGSYQGVATLPDGGKVEEKIVIRVGETTIVKSTVPK